ncbi:MAG TPA: zinc-binding dehydrogenase, partial [Clostridia bacterium]|nr:zinc-binding dehydrogenase [Clostridia bacterium]
ALHGIRRAFRTPLPRTVVAVWALGPVGLMAVQGVRCFEGVEKVIALDPVAFRRKVALELGADEAYDPRDPKTESILKSQNEGRGVNYAINCGLRREEDTAFVFSTLKSDGFLMNITGVAKSGFQSARTIAGSYYFPISEYYENLRLVREGKIKLAPVISHEFPLDKINDAMELRSHHPDKALKIIIRCSDAD